MTKQFIRKATLQVMKPAQTGDSQAANIPAELLDLSELHFQFKTANQDDEGPNNCAIRVYNLSQSTVQKLLKFNYTRVILQAGYEGSFGVIFDGTIKQFKPGRENNTDTYLDILAADGDLGYNFAVINDTAAAGSTPQQRATQVAAAFDKYGVKLGQDLAQTGGTLPRGKVLFGMARTFMTNESTSRLATWSISNGVINIIPLDGYLPGEAVVLNAGTGLIGIPEQTIDGIRCRALLNPRIVVGGRVQIDNALINKTVQANGNPFGIPFNQWAAPQFLANVSNDGFYRVYVAEYTGDTRGQDWYVDLVCLSIDATTNKVKPYG